MFNVQALLESLPMMGYGMLGIFIAVAVIILTVVVLGKIFPVKNNDSIYKKPWFFHGFLFCRLAVFQLTADKSALKIPGIKGNQRVKIAFARQRASTA